MSQHTYTVKFTIKINNPEDGVYLIQGETRERKPELLSRVMNEGGDTKEDLIKADIEKKIKEAIPAEQGIIQVLFDSLTEA